MIHHRTCIVAVDVPRSMRGALVLCESPEARAKQTQTSVSARPRQNHAETQHGGTTPNLIASEPHGPSLALILNRTALVHFLAGHAVAESLQVTDAAPTWPQQTTQVRRWHKTSPDREPLDRWPLVPLLQVELGVGQQRK